ncbi:MAG: AraC family transcriptional regulator [Flavobacteriaceae bacterium]|nr:AraC family transcriptional regulator [Flavobacteriaceae bacterium]
MNSIFVKFDTNFICKKLLEDKLNELGIEYKITGRGKVVFKEPLSLEKRAVVDDVFKESGMEIVESGANALVQRIKDSISALIEGGEGKKYKLSTVLSEKLNYSYAHLSNVFSENNYTSIENFLILKKIDHAKYLLLNENLTLTEIAHRLNYSSVSHLSSQFKKTTGLTPSTFQKLMFKRLKAKQEYKLAK